ncbi:MAG: uracil-DNA glycosylase family protein [Candidatus Dormibacteria bacterium]
MIPTPSDPAPAGARQGWVALHSEILACTRCVASGHIPFASPMFQGVPGQRLMLVGQAPGERELGPRKPFAGRSGAELARWMTRAGFRDDDHFRTETYITSVTKCFPGKAASGVGDRRPSGVEVGQCRPWLEGQLELLRPGLVMLVGGLAHEAFAATRGRGLNQLVGRALDGAGRDHTLSVQDGTWGRVAIEPPWIVPLPHPSGASRWLNSEANRDLLAQALEVLSVLWPVVAAAPGH